MAPAVHPAMAWSKSTRPVSFDFSSTWRDESNLDRLSMKSIGNLLEFSSEGQDMSSFRDWQEIIFRPFLSLSLLFFLPFLFNFFTFSLFHFFHFFSTSSCSWISQSLFPPPPPPPPPPSPLLSFSFVAKHASFTISKGLSLLSPCHFSSMLCLEFSLGWRGRRFEFPSYTQVW